MKFYYEHIPERKWAYRFVSVSYPYLPVRIIKDEILIWLKESFGPIKGHYRFDPSYLDLAFKEEGDAQMFRLKWVTVITNQKPEYLKS